MRQIAARQYAASMERHIAVKANHPAEQDVMPEPQFAAAHCGKLRHTGADLCPDD